MAHFSDDVHHRISTRLSETIPDFVESEYPTFVAFLKAYYEFLEQYDELPIASTYTLQNGVVSVRAGNSIILGANTQFSNTSIYANNGQFRVGSDTFRIRSIANNTQLTVYDVPVRSYFANTHTVETNKTVRQASGAVRQILTFHQVDETLDDFIAYFRDTYLKDIPQGLTDTAVLMPRILDFYQARGSEASYEFLFRALYGKEIKFSYPRESVFTTSDNEWVKPVIMRLDYANNTVVTGNVELLETREIIGLTSNARATVLQTVTAYEGARRVVRMFTTEPIIALDPGGILLEDGSGQLIVTKFGIPPEGLSNLVYEFTLLRDEMNSLTFQVGETVSTIPTNDPDAITGELVGSITGFTIESRGAGYQLGDFVYPPARFANGAVFTGGFGGVGQITAFTDVDLTEVNIDNPGVGYYAGLPLIVDNTGTGGGSGLSGYVSAVSPGNLLLHADDSAGIDDGDILLFTDINEVDYEASREKIDYYEVGISLTDVFGGLQLNSDNLDDDGDDLLSETGQSSASELCLDDATDPYNDGSNLLDEDDNLLALEATEPEQAKQLLQEIAIVLGDTSWSSNVGSAIYGANLATTIVGLTSNLSVFPVYVNGVRTEVGQVFELAIESFGAGYVAGLPTVGVQTPEIPTSDSTGLEPLTYEEIFGEAFENAELSVAKEIGQIGEVSVIKGGSGYANAAFFVSGIPVTQLNFLTEDGLFVELEDGTGYLMLNAEGAGYAATSSTLNGNGAKLALTLGAISRGEPYFRTTRSFASADQYLQDITKYQPFSYVLTVEEDLSRYATALRRLVHPAGGLLLPRQTITSDIDLNSLINLEGIDFTFLIEEDLSSSPPSIKTIFITAPSVSVALGLKLTTSGAIDVSAPSVTLASTVGVTITTNEIVITDATITLDLKIPVVSNTITVSNEEETQYLYMPVSASVVDLSAPTGSTSIITGIAAGQELIDVLDPAISVATTVAVTTSESVITLSTGEETEHLFVPVVSAVATITAPTIDISTTITVSTNTNLIASTSPVLTVATTVAVTTSESVVTLSTGEETEHLMIPVSTGEFAITAPTITIESGPTSVSVSTATLDILAPNEVVAAVIVLPITFDTIIEPYETTQVSSYETTLLITIVNWEAPPIYVTAPTATLA